MRSQLLLTSAVILGLVFTGKALAEAGDRDVGQHQFVGQGQVIDRSDVGHNRGLDQGAFVGLWQGLDSSDGSTQFLSITCSHRRSCDVRLNDTAFTTSCQNQIGFAQGEGSIKGLVLTVDLTLSCSNLDGTSNTAGSQVNEFVLDRKNRTLTNINDDPFPLSNVFHKISQ